MTDTSLSRAIQDAARTRQTGVSLQTLLAFGRQTQQGVSRTGSLVTSSVFLKRELPIRFAHRILELDALPHKLCDMPSIRRVSQWYKTSFREIVAFPQPHDAASEAAFTSLLRSIYERHAPTLVMMARGIYEYRRSLGVPLNAPLGVIEDDVQRYLDVFFTSRVGIRTLIAQHLALHEPPTPARVGIISTKCAPRDVLADAVSDARSVAERHFLDVPEVQVHGAADFSFAYVPAYMHHILFELIKNSMRATVETATARGARTLPPIKVILAAGANSEDVVVKVSDEGGGIPRSGMARLYSYFYTTAAPQFKEEDEELGADFSRETPMAGLGVGLPLSRVYARYFGGDLSLMSMEGYGTDAYVFLRRLGDAAEPLSECAHTGAFADEFARTLAFLHTPPAWPNSSGGAGTGASHTMTSATEVQQHAAAVSHPHAAGR